jgi:hypothetical protein
MKSYCCEGFKGHAELPKQAGPNIRIVKGRSDTIVSGGMPYRFFITFGYEGDFQLEMPMMNIAFCPYCGTNLYVFYTSDEYASEIEGITFRLKFR